MAETISFDEIPDNAHGFMAEQPYRQARPNEIRDHHTVYNYLVVERDVLAAEQSIAQLLGKAGLERCGVIKLNHFLMKTLSNMTNENGRQLQHEPLTAGDIIQFDYASNAFAMIRYDRGE